MTRALAQASLFENAVELEAYWQISYTRQMKSRTEYVRPEWVKEIRRQTVIHKRFKRLVDQWIDLSIEHSRLTMQIAEPRANR